MLEAKVTLDGRSKAYATQGINLRQSLALIDLLYALDSKYLSATV